MNIFVLHNDPLLAAMMLDDLRVPKMIVESGQMLATALRAWGMDDDDLVHTGVVTLKGTPWRSTHRNHPCTVWARESRSNFLWLAEHALGLCYEYRHRFGKTHGSESAIEAMESLASMIPEGPLTPFALAMPDEFKTDDTVASYRAYFRTKPCRWVRKSAPIWW